MHYIHWGFLCSILCAVSVARADCPLADKIAREKGLDAALETYNHCAIVQNDDEAQLYLAHIYEKGQGNVYKNPRRAILFYHLSAENGNATAMVDLAKLLTQLDDNDSTRDDIITYMDKIQGQLRYTSGSSFTGKLLHPYALLMLAAESPEIKWFYSSKQKSDPRASQLLNNYAIDPEKKKEVIRAASQWKRRKMLDLAREVFSVKEYNEFYRTLYPKEGLPNAFARSQAVEKLKARVESRQK
ncbi:MAG: sel1 repeat family protein [Alphaproteobacteria bacterium]|nr:sel1 repeat family protein [Alphaproteobacteria bacterium]